MASFVSTSFTSKLKSLESNPAAYNLFLNLNQAETGNDIIAALDAYDEAVANNN